MREVTTSVLRAIVCHYEKYRGNLFINPLWYSYYEVIVCSFKLKPIGKGVRGSCVLGSKNHQTTFAGA
jgi:hypothetical protein